MPDEPTDADLRTIADKWDREALANRRRDPTLRTRWWMHPYVIRQLNRRLCGQSVGGWSGGMQGLVRAAYGNDLPCANGISVGGGTGGKEMDLIEAGIVDHMTVYELSPGRIEVGVEMARTRGLEARIEFRQDDAFAIEIEPSRYDLVHWDNSLHHMFDVAAALRWSRDMLMPGGLFYLYDFVGPSRFQWTQPMLDLATAIRSGLPADYLVNPNDPSTSVDKVFAHPPSVESMIAKDPSEAADSGRILDELDEVFPEATVIPTGGVVYNLALNDIIHNFSWDPLDPLLTMLMLLDAQASDAGLNHYAAAVARVD